MLYLIVFLGAGIGGALRHGVNVGAARLFGYGFPLGTLIVNIAGSFLIAPCSSVEAPANSLRTSAPPLNSCSIRMLLATSW